MAFNPAPVGSLLKTPKGSKTKRDMGRNPRVHDEKHLKFIRSLPCASCGREPAGEAAHLRASSLRYAKPNAGLGAKPDDRWVTPLCHWCHVEGPQAQHRVGEEAFWTRLGVNPHHLCTELFDATGNREAAENVLIHARGGAFPPAKHWGE